VLVKAQLPEDTKWCLREATCAMRDLSREPSVGGRAELCRLMDGLMEWREDGTAHTSDKTSGAAEATPPPVHREPAAAAGDSLRPAGANRGRRAGRRTTTAPESQPGVPGQTEGGDSSTFGSPGRPRRRPPPGSGPGRNRPRIRSRNQSCGARWPPSVRSEAATYRTGGRGRATSPTLAM